MASIYLPSLKRIHLKNYSLYPNGLDFEHEFIKGVNLIIGGNGMGKTTFINLIKYAIIGHYKKDLDFTRTYKEREITRRTSYSRDYFSNRQDPSIIVEQKPSVTIEFEINKTQFVIERCLIDISLKAVIVGSKPLVGDTLNQFKYDELFNQWNREENNSKRKADLEEKLHDTLQFKFETVVAESLTRPFDDLIFFVNEILYFGEEHKTILWNDGTQGANVQNELFNKYFNQPEFDEERKRADRQAKYFDSIARHKSEDQRAIKKVLEKVQGDNSKGIEANIHQKIIQLRSNIESCNTSLKKLQKQRDTVESEIGMLNNSINEKSQQETAIEKEKKLAEHNMLESKWKNLHKNYNLFLQSIKANHLCPMCNNELEQAFVEKRLSKPHTCYLCEQKIVSGNNKELEGKFSDFEKKLQEIYNIINNAQKLVIDKEKYLKQLDSEFRSKVVEKNKAESELRKLEYQNSQTPSNPDDQLKAFYEEIDLLESQKVEFQEKSRIEREKADRISAQIEDRIQKNTLKFSSLFADFAGNFLGVPCELTFIELENEGRRFYPIINGKLRMNEEELSESQRFFVDHAFRMSILSFFYNKPAFYMVETPDSSLDISYEKNAADVFLKFLKKPNTLIITTNLNNSQFLLNLIESTIPTSVIDLLEIGKKSEIQSSSQTMTTIYRKIRSKI